MRTTRTRRREECGVSSRKKSAKMLVLLITSRTRDLPITNRVLGLKIKREKGIKESLKLTILQWLILPISKIVSFFEHLVFFRAAFGAEQL